MTASNTAVATYEQLIPSPTEDLGASHSERLEGQVRSPGWLTRLGVRARSGSFDRALIAGADPTSSLQLSIRAASLCAPSSRASLAEGLDRWLEVAQAPASRRRVSPARHAILANEPELRALSALLRGSSELRAGGLAFLMQLLTDGTGPAYHCDGDRLSDLLDQARHSM